MAPNDMSEVAQAAGIGEHDPYRYVSYLRQALESPKRPIGFLLGAGCPVAVRTPDGEPLIPAIAGMTTRVISEVEAGASRPVLEAVRSRMTDGHRSPNIEEFLSQIRMLREVAAHLDPAVLTEDSLDELDKEMCEAIHRLACVTLPGLDTPYHNLAAWTRGLPRNLPVQLFTTNYDLLLEEALEAVRVPYFDGFIGSRTAFFDPAAIEVDASSLPGRWARLWKLHGSVNWWLSNLGGALEVVRAERSTGTARLIYPSHLKYDETRQMPYLAMMDRLKAFLRQPAAILVCSGFSFGDRHIDALIRQALSGNPDAAVFGLMFGRLEENEPAVTLARTTPNLSILARDGGVIGTRPGLWRARGAPDEAPIGVVVRESGSEGTAAPRQFEVTLGDFAKFGLLLRDLIGRTEPDSGNDEAARVPTVGDAS